MKFKKYVLSFLFTVCLIMPVVFLISSCKDDSSPTQYIREVQNEVAWEFCDVGSFSQEGGARGSTLDTNAVNKGSIISYDIILRNDQDINKLKVFVNGVEVEYERYPEFSTDVVIDDTEWQRAGKVTVKNVSSDSIFSATCSSKIVKFKFATEQGVDLTGDQRTILSDFIFSNGTSLAEIINGIGYTEISFADYFNNGGFKVKCDKKVGYYKVDNYSVIENGYFSPVFSKDLNEYLIMSNNSLRNENTIIIKPENIDVNTYKINYVNTTALSVKATNLENNFELLPGDLAFGVSAEREIEYEFTLNKEYDVDISNAELYVLDTKLDRFSANEDKIVWKFNSKEYLPCQFLKNPTTNSYDRLSESSLNRYNVTLKGLDFTNYGSLCKITLDVADDDLEHKAGVDYYSPAYDIYYYDLQNTVYVKYDSERQTNEYLTWVYLQMFEKAFTKFEITKGTGSPVTIDVAEKLSEFNNGVYKIDDLGIEIRIFTISSGTETSNVTSVDEIDCYQIVFSFTGEDSFIVNIK